MATIYSAYAANDIDRLEKMIGYALGLVNIPPPGGPELSFSLGGDDCQFIYPALSESIPTSNQSVAIIFNQLGMFSHIYLLLCLELPSGSLVYLLKILLTSINNSFSIIALLFAICKPCNFSR